MANLRIAHSYCNGSSGKGPQTSTRYTLTDTDRKILGKINLICGGTLAVLERSKVTDRAQRRAIMNKIDEREPQASELTAAIRARPWRLIRNLRLQREVRTLQAKNHEDFKAIGTGS